MVMRGAALRLLEVALLVPEQPIARDSRRRVEPSVPLKPGFDQIGAAGAHHERRNLQFVCRACEAHISAADQRLSRGRRLSEGAPRTRRRTRDEIS
eukprot:4302438-Pleurochrysis_carterae.AAC.1